MQGSGDDQRRIWLLAGTGEGPSLAQALLDQGWWVRISVVTSKAAEAYSGLGVQQLSIGALAGPAGIASVLEQEGPFTWVLDATHPFATQITAELQQVCSLRQQPLLRLDRSAEVGSVFAVLNNLSDLEDRRLEGRRVLLAIGSRHLALAVGAAQKAGAIAFARVLPSVEGLRAALAVGLPSDQLAVLRPLQGDPPGVIERALCCRWSITDVVCRQSGGVTERLWRDICLDRGLRLWLVRRPSDLPDMDTVVGQRALLERLSDDGLPYTTDVGSDDGGRSGQG